MTPRPFLTGPDDPGPLPPERPPRPGHGRVWINGGAPDHWWASWQDEEDGVVVGVEESPHGTRDEAIAHARRMPAADRWIFSEEDGDYLDLDVWEARA